MNNDEFIFPGCENIEKKEDKKIWYWGECMKDAALVGCKRGTLTFWVVYKIRVYETHGNYKFCVAGAERLAEDIGCGVTPRQVEIAQMEACQKGQLFHIWCDKKVYRNKTKIFVTKQWLEERGLSAEQIKVLSRGRNNTHKLTGKIDENGEIVEAKIVKNEPKTKGKTLETKGKTLETKGKTLETKGKTLELPRMNKCKNVCKGMCGNECTVTKVTEQTLKNQVNNDELSNQSDSSEIGQQTLPLKEGLNQAPNQNQTSLSINQPQDYEPKEKNSAKREKVRIVDENGKVCGGNPLTERAYELWNEIMGQPCKRDKWNSQAGWNMMRAKAKGEEWLRTMLIIARECKKDPKADFRASHVANLADLQKNQDAVMGWARNEKLRKDTEADKSLDFLRQNS